MPKMAMVTAMDSFKILEAAVKEHVNLLFNIKIQIAKVDFVFLSLFQCYLMQEMSFLHPGFDLKNLFFFHLSQKYNFINNKSPFLPMLTEATAFNWLKKIVS
jgi:hypothetical protein